MRAISIGARASSPRLRRACARFGLRLTHESSTPPASAKALSTLGRLQPGGIALLTGRSGCGKSALLRAFRQERCALGEEVATPAAGNSAARVIDAIGGSLAQALATLARVGLADATILPRRVRDLSEGERARFMLGAALRWLDGQGSRRGNSLDGPPRASWLLIDEFLSVVDRQTARSVAAGMRRAWSCSPGAMPRLIVATAHDDLAGDLCPDVLLDLDTFDPVAFCPAPIRPAPIRPVPIAATPTAGGDA